MAVWQVLYKFLKNTSRFRLCFVSQAVAESVLMLCKQPFVPMTDVMARCDRPVCEKHRHHTWMETIPRDAALRNMGLTLKEIAGVRYFPRVGYFKRDLLQLLTEPRVRRRAPLGKERASYEMTLARQRVRVAQKNMDRIIKNGGLYFQVEKCRATLNRAIARKCLS